MCLIVIRLAIIFFALFVFTALPGFADDGTRDGWYMLLKSESNRIRITWHRLSYDAERSHRSMQEAGLAKGYADALLSGLWPSQDVLPDIEQSQQGQPINPQPLFFMSK